jgi:hypothetical protein
MSPDGDDEGAQPNQGSRGPEVLQRREIAEQAGAKAAEQYEGLKIAFSHGRWLPTLRSRESLDQALRGDCRLLGERVRSGAVSHDEREFLEEFINGRITPGKGLYNQRRAKARRQQVADFVSKMKLENPQMQLKAIVDKAKERFGISRTEVFNSLKEHESN